MGRPTTVKIKLNGSTTWIDVGDKWGFTVIEADKWLGPKYREYESIRYPEENGERIYPYTTMEPFDYSVKFVCEGTQQDVNSKVSNFYNSLFASKGEIRKGVEFDLVIDYYKILLHGVAKEMTVSEYFEDNNSSYWLFELKMRIPNPNKCNFNYE